MQGENGPQLHDSPRRGGLTWKGSGVGKCTNEPVSSAVLVVCVRAMQGLNRLSLEETNLPCGGKLTTSDPFHSEGAGIYFNGYPYSFQAGFALCVFRDLASAFS